METFTIVRTYTDKYTNQLTGISPIQMDLTTTKEDIKENYKEYIKRYISFNGDTSLDFYDIEIVTSKTLYLMNKDLQDNVNNFIK